MTRWGELCFMVSLVLTVQGVSNSTTISTEITSANATLVAASSNVTAHYIMVPKRKGVLTILSNDSDIGLRSKKKLKSSKTITCLKYEEYDEEGNLLNSVFMYNLEQVANFFKEYLDTTVCNQQCNF